MPVLLLKFHLTLSALPSAPQVPDVAGGVFHSSSSAANATVGAIDNSMQNDNIADNNRFFITFPPYFIRLNGINIKKRFQDMATHDLKAFSYLFGTAQKGRVLLALRCEQCIAPRIGLSSSFSRCTPPSAK